MSAPFGNPIACTRFTATNPPRLSKRFTLSGDTLAKESGGNMLSGIAERLTIASLAEFAALLPTLTPQQALSYGVNGHARARVVTDDALPFVAAKSADPVIARTRDHFKWPAGAGLLMLDYDPAPDGPPLPPDELRAALVAACPALATAPAVWRPSASSCIFTAQGAELRPIGGQRLYVAVADAADIPRALEVLVARLWLAGFGRWELSKSGAWLARTVVDASVAQPERLDFCGGADCGAGLEQRLPEPVVLNPAAPYLDTQSALPDLDASERHRLAELREALKEPLKEHQRAIREIWIAERVDARLSAIPEAKRAEARPKLEKVYREAASGGRLGLDFELIVVRKGGNGREPLTVGDVLKDRERYHEATTCDPLEPDYPDGQGRLVGWLNLRAREPYLTSQAHGGTRYLLGAEPTVAPIDEELLARCGIDPGREPGCDDDRGEATDKPEPGSAKRTLIPIQEFLAMPPAGRRLIKGYLNLDTINNIFGESGGGKTFVGIDIACHVATGRPWRGLPTTEGVVVYLAAEGQYGLRARFKAWFMRHGERERNILIRTIPTSLIDPAAVADLIQEVRVLGLHVVLVVVDTVNRNFGCGDENSTKDMTAFVAGMDALRIETGGAAVTGIHHNGLADKGRGRGSSVLRAALDCEYHVTQNDGVIVLKNTKAKDFSPPPPLAWTLTPQGTPWADEDGIPINSAVLEPVDRMLTAKPMLTRPQRIALETLRSILNGDDHALVGDWREAAFKAGITQSESKQGKSAAFLRAMEALVDAGLVRVDGNRCYPAQESTRSTNGQQVDSVDLGNGWGERSTRSTHPYRGVDSVDPPQAPDSNEQTPSPNSTDSPLARRILAALDGHPGGMDRADLLRMVGNGKGASPAMLDAEVNRLLLARKLATVNGRLIAEPAP